MIRQIDAEKNKMKRTEEQIKIKMSQVRKRLNESLRISKDLDEDNTQEKIYKLYDDIETNITLLGVTAIEDKLQYKAEETINKFINIGVKIW